VRAMSAVVTSPQRNGRVRALWRRMGEEDQEATVLAAQQDPRDRPGAVPVPTALLLSIVSTTWAVLGNMVFGNLGRLQDSPAFPLGLLV
jgi:hypothetical protein